MLAIPHSLIPPPSRHDSGEQELTVDGMERGGRKEIVGKDISFPFSFHVVPHLRSFTWHARIDWKDEMIGRKALIVSHLQSMLGLLEGNDRIGTDEEQDRKGKIHKIKTIHSFLSTLYSLMKWWMEKRWRDEVGSLPFPSPFYHSSIFPFFYVTSGVREDWKEIGCGTHRKVKEGRAISLTVPS